MGMETAVTDIVTAIKPELWWMLVQAGAVLAIVMILKKSLENLTAYLMFRYNKHLGNGVRVILNGMEGVIEDYDKSNIYVKVEGGHHLIMPITRWRFQNWIVKDFTKELTKEKEC